MAVSACRGKSVVRQRGREPDAVVEMSVGLGSPTSLPNLSDCQARMQGSTGEVGRHRCGSQTALPDRAHIENRSIDTTVKGRG